MATKKSTPTKETPSTAKSPAAKSTPAARAKGSTAAAKKEPAPQKPTPAQPAAKAAATAKPQPAKAASVAKSAAKSAVKAEQLAAPAAVKAPPVKSKPAAAAKTPSAPAAEPKDKWSEIRDILLQMKQEALQEIVRSIKSGSESSAAEETSGDIYDQASSERDRELELLLNDREREKLHNIDEALLRMSEGEYGICEECDEDIPVGRLKVLPFTRHCVKCKSDLERIQAQTRWVDDSRAYREIPTGDEEE